MAAVICADLRVTASTTVTTHTALLRVGQVADRSRVENQRHIAVQSGEEQSRVKYSVAVASDRRTDRKGVDAEHEVGSLASQETACSEGTSQRGSRPPPGPTFLELCSVHSTLGKREWEWAVFTSATIPGDCCVPKKQAARRRRSPCSIVPLRKVQDLPWGSLQETDSTR